MVVLLGFISRHNNFNYRENIFALTKALYNCQSYLTVAMCFKIQINKVEGDVFDYWSAFAGITYGLYKFSSLNGILPPMVNREAKTIGGFVM